MDDSFSIPFYECVCECVLLPIKQNQPVIIQIISLMHNGLERPTINKRYWREWAVVRQRRGARARTFLCSFCECKCLVLVFQIEIALNISRETESERARK